jgi:hypothetical protein
MIPLSRRRPRSIQLFAAAFLAAALLGFLVGLRDIPVQQAYLQNLIPAFDWSRDAVIVWRSAWLSIALIPIAMVWFSAVRFARWMVTFMALAKLMSLITVVPHLMQVVAVQPLWLVTLLLGLLAVALLFTPSSNRWFANGPEPDPATFE